MPLWSIPLLFFGAFIAGTGIVIGIGALVKRFKARKEAKVQHDGD